MIFFNKKNNKDNEQQTTDDSQQVVGQQTVSQVPVSADGGINFILEDIESSTHPKRNPHILNSTQLQRVKDAKRLAETKLQGLEESLGRLQSQRQWLRRFNETKMVLDREKKHLFELGKQKAILQKDASMLERYDLFEGIHGTYQKLMVLREQISQEKRGLSLLERETDENRQKLTDQEKRQQQANEQLKNAKTSMTSIFDHVCSAYQLTGANDSLETETAFLIDYNNKVKEHRATQDEAAKHGDS